MASASPPTSSSREIPTRRIEVSDPSQLPVDYSSTPGGTWFSTTPGGTRIVYDRSKLMMMRNSPLSRTPPTNLPNIPGVTSPLGATSGTPKTVQEEPEEKKAGSNSSTKTGEDEQFDMEM